jgi:hypothetical protein
MGWPARLLKDAPLVAAGIGNHPPLLGLAGSTVAGGVAGTVTALLAVGLAAVSALGAAGDRPGAGAGLGGVAFAVQLHHHPGAQHRVVLGASHPLGQLPTRPGPDGELVVVERHKHRVQARGGRPPAALVGGLDGALADGFGVALGHAEAVAGEGFAQGRPGGAQLGGGGVDAAEPLGQGEGALGLGAAGQEAAGLPAQRDVGRGSAYAGDSRWRGGARAAHHLVNQNVPVCSPGPDCSYQVRWTDVRLHGDAPS